MSILDEMRNEQQETEPSSTASNLSEPTNADVIAAVNRQTKAVNGLKSYLRIAIEETVKEELKGLPSTLQPSVNKSPQIESTLREFAQSLDGKQLQSASQSLIAEAQMNRAATASATEKLQSLAEDNQKLVSQVGGAVQRIEKRTEERVEKAVEQVTGEASATMTANIDASNERAERIIAATATLGPVSSGRSPRRCASPPCRWSWSSPGSGWASPGSLRALSGRWTGRERVARDRALARGRRWPRRGRLRPLRVRALGRRLGGDVEGPRDADVAGLAQEVTAIPEGKRAERVRQPLHRDDWSACTV